MAGTVKLTKKELFKMLAHTAPSTVANRIDVSTEEFYKVCKQNNIDVSKKKIFREALTDGDKIIEFKCNWKRRRKIESSYGSKANAICILQTLEDYSDANKSLTVAEIISLMDRNYMQTIDRKTLYSTIDMLRDLGYDIHQEKISGKNYYALIEQTLEPYETKIIVDSIRLNPLVPDDMGINLCKKVDKYMSVKGNIKQSRISYIGSLPCEKYYTSNTIYSIIDILDEATAKERMISFEYIGFNNNNKTIIVAPIAIVAENFTYYLFCHNESEGIYTKYRLDRITKIELLDEINEDGFYPELFNKYSPGILNQKDKPEITLKCDKDFLDYITDHFARYMSLINIIDDSDTESFSFKIKINPEEIINFAVSHADKCEVVSPVDIRNKVIDRIKNNKYGV